jgi:protein transport protein SEC24
VSIDEDLKDSREVSFQAAFLYTSSKGKRRIRSQLNICILDMQIRFVNVCDCICCVCRVHTLCLPTSASLQEVVQGADQHCIVGLLSKMAVDRSGRGFRLIVMAISNYDHSSGDHGGGGDHNDHDLL